jgi:hypothetical protein
LTQSYARKTRSFLDGLHLDGVNLRTLEVTCRSFSKRTTRIRCGCKVYWKFGTRKTQMSFTKKGFYLCFVVTKVLPEIGFLIFVTPRRLSELTTLHPAGQVGSEPLLIRFSWKSNLNANIFRRTVIRKCLSSEWKGRPGFAHLSFTSKQNTLYGIKTPKRSLQILRQPSSKLRSKIKIDSRITSQVPPARVLRPAGVSPTFRGFLH